MAVRAASRAGLAPKPRPTPPPVDPRLRPWYDRCRQDHDRLATVQVSSQTVYQAKLYYQQMRQLVDAYRALASDYAQLLAAVGEVREALRTTDLQLALPLPELRELPEVLQHVETTKRGSKRAAAD